MIKECAKRKLIITTFALIVFLITLTFPKTEEEIKNITISYSEPNTWPIYLLDKDNYVSRTTMVLKTENEQDKIKEIIEILTIDHVKAAYIPTLFTPVLPKGTQVLSIDTQDKVLKINFNKNFLNVPVASSQKMIECLVFSLTELENIDGVIIFVEGKLLENIPHTEEKLPPILTRDLGVNKITNINSLKNVIKTTTYFIAKNNDTSYYVPVTLLSNDSKDKVEIIIERLKTLPHANTNLMSYLNASTELTNYEILQNEILLSFNPYLYEGLASEKLKEEVKYSIALSMKDTLNIDKVTFQELKE